MKLVTLHKPGYLALWRSAVLLSGFILLNTQINAQPLISPQPDVTAGTESFYTLQDRFNRFFESEQVSNGFVERSGRQEKFPNWKIYKRWEHYWEQRVDRRTGEFPVTTAAAEYEKAKPQLKKSSSYSENWTNMGTNTTTGGYAGLGRINCVAFHPTDNNTFWVGSPSGGIWKTTNGGGSWTILNNNLAVLGVSDIAVPSDYATSNTIYIVTGDRDGGSMWSMGGGQVADNASIGILKSTDGGSTWNATGLTYTASQKKLVYSLLMHPTNNQILIASATDGIYKSTDGGTTWTQKNVNRFCDLEFKPGDPTIVYAAATGYSYGYVFRSTNTGDSWSTALTVTNGRRGEVAVAPSDPAIVYFAVANSGGGVLAVYKSTDSGVNFTSVNAGSPAGMLGYYSDGSGGATGQNSYDFCMAVDPANASIVYLGGITTWKSTDGGATFSVNNMWTTSTAYNFNASPEVHADQHCLEFQTNTTLFEGNDGGLYKTTNGGTSWTDLSNGLIISQIYRIGVSKTDPARVLAGLQDNGSKLYKGALNTWADVTGGDGFECIIDNNSATSYMYATYTNGKIYRNSNGFSTTSTTTISANIPGGQPAGAWVTPYIMSPSNSAVLYAGYDKVWKTTNRGSAWTSASQYLSTVSKLRSLAIAPSNESFLYAAEQDTMWKTTDGGATNWTNVPLPTTVNSLTYISVKNNDPNTVWISYGGFTADSKIYQSTDGGANWTNISAGLPNIPVMCVIQYTAATDRVVLFAGTDVGVYVKNGSNNWESFNTGLPNVVVPEIEVYYDQVNGVNKLRAGTFGRGLWETTISSVLPVLLSSFSAHSYSWNIELSWSTSTEINSSKFIIERSTDNMNWNPAGSVDASGYSNSPKYYSFIDRKLTIGKYFYRLKSLDNDGTFEYSKTINAEVLVPYEFDVSQNYPNPFNPETKVKIALPEPQTVKLVIFNQLGQRVAVLLEKQCDAGIFEATWNASGVSSGTYYLELKSEKFSAVKKLMLIR